MSKVWEPHNYQLTALSFLLSNPKSGLFMDPGLGKTSVSLSAMRILKHAGQTNGVLLIAPLRVTYSVWPREIEKWSNFQGLTHHVLHEDEGKSALWETKADIYLINPEGLSWLVSALLSMVKQGKKIPFNALWIDESTKFKNHKAKTRFDPVVAMLPLFKRRHIMTGTPAPKSLLDLWSQAYILDEGEALTNNFYHFRNKYFKTNDWNKHKYFLKGGSAEKIHQMIAPLVLEMSAKDHLDMPELVFNDIGIKLPDKAFEHYKQMEREFFAEIGNRAATAQTTATASMKCHQIANGNVYEDTPREDGQPPPWNKKVIPVHKAKLEALQDLIDELNGKPLLVAYHYQHDLEALKSILGKKLPYIGSGVSPSVAKAIESDWNAGKIPVLAGHPDSMAHGLNFQDAGNDVCWFSLTWNLENYIQFIARVWRQGVKGAYVRVHHLISEGTVDEAMLLRLGEKAEEQNDLRSALKEYRRSLTSLR